MSLFGKKKDESPKGPPSGLTGTIITIPEVFYGGADPVIHYASEAARTVPSIQPVKKTPALAGPPAKKPPAPASKKRTLYVVLGGVFFLLFLGLTGWYYVRQAKQRALPPPRPIARPAQRPPEPPPAPVEPPPPPVVVPPPAPTIAERVGQFPRMLLTDTPDIDADSLTDEEETILTTDSGVWDSDADGYFDGQEVANLYNPKGFAPIRLVDSGLIREYIHPRLQYRIYYPVQWEAAPVDAAGDQVIFSDASGDFVEVRALPKDTAESFDAWFGRVISGQQITDLSPFSSRFKEDGRRRRDSLTAYFDRGSAVYILVYHPAVEDAIRYRHIMMMMQESFRPGISSVELPPQVPLPQEPATTE